MESLLYVQFDLQLLLPRNVGGAGRAGEFNTA
jgi:hypothetical protein